MNLNFDFLKNVELNVPSRKETVRSSVDKNPSGGLFLRVFASGKIFPSVELVEKYNLEYVNKDSEEVANGLDIFKSKDWPMFPVTSENQFIFIAPVPKTSPKVDLFGQVGYNEDGTPKNSVLEQGGGSFGQTLLEMLLDVYDITIDKGSYIDLEIKSDVVVKSPNDIYYVPKTVTRGEKKGEITVLRRENIEVMPLAPVVEETEVEKVEEVVEDTQTSVEFEEEYTTPAYEDTSGPESFDSTSDDLKNMYPEIPDLD